MQISVENPPLQTIFFLAIFLALLVISIKNINRASFFDHNLTDGIKGFAILAVVFSHIGFFLSKDNQFLFPVSVSAGVAVNLFLFISGFGLTSSAISNPMTPLKFYKKRLKRIFVPLWIILGLLLLMDKILLNNDYTLTAVIQNFLGFFPRADVWLDLNSPLWYFTFILFYYLIFPFLFFKKAPYFSVLLVFLSGILLLKMPLPINKDVLKLYQLHIFALPLGMLLAVLINDHNLQFIKNRLTNTLPKALHFVIYWSATSFLVTIFIYTSFNSGVNEEINKEQLISLLTTLSLIILFYLIKIRLAFLQVFGVYSYEIYLLHWPILSRHDLFYKNLPPFLATFSYLLLFICLGYLLHRLSGLLIHKETKIL